jgi:hypothetical protein
MNPLIPDAMTPQKNALPKRLGMPSRAISAPF